MPKGPDPEDILGRVTDRNRLLLDWESFGLSYLLGVREQGALFEPIFGPNVNPENRAVLGQEQVRTTAELIRGLTTHALRERWRPEEMLRLGVYPQSAWTEPDALEALLAAFETVKAFFEQAAKNGRAIVVDVVV